MQAKTTIPSHRHPFARAWHHRSLLLLGAAVLLLLATTRLASAQILYTAGSGDQFGTLNVTTGAYTPIGTGFTTYNGTNTLLSGVAYAANGNLYGLDYTARFFQINRSTGVLTLIGTASGLANTNRDITIGNTSDGTIYGIYAASTTTGPNLYTINPTTGASTLVGNTGNTYFDGGLGGDGSGNLFATGGSGGSQSFKVNRVNGAATVLAATTVAASTYALGFTNGNLYGLDLNGGIYTFNTTTGAATNTGVTYNVTTAGASQGVAPLLFVPTTVPEPSTWALLGAGAGLLTLLSLRRRLRRA